MPKILQHLSKRRKNQLINEELQCHKNQFSLHSIKSNIAYASTSEADITFQNSHDISSDNVISQNENEDDVLFMHSDVESIELLSEKDNKEHNNEIQNIIPESTDYTDCETSLQEDLQRLIIEYTIPHTTANKLLEILRKHGHAELPADIRVLLSTPRNASVNIKSMGDGQYMHFGLLSGLKRSIQTYIKFITGHVIKFNINVDGLPISKSSGSQFWPIMGSIEEINIYTSPFIIGIYHGMSKPNNANEFLTDFVNEYIQLSETGITVCNTKYTVVLHAILCDAPAKSFITYTKGHTGYFSCSKCIQEGDFVCNRVTFPETNNMLRTNDTFRNRAQIEHHTGNSLLENLNIGMVSQIPIDYMHLVCLGVVKRLLQFWLKGKKNVRLSAENVQLVSRYLIAIKTCIPSEFKRKPRELYDVDRWKATEFRQFLLYTGCVVLKPVISSLCYDHFLCLSIAIRILTDPLMHVTYNTYAHSLLLWFVSNYGHIYGDEYVSHNVHNLLHLALDVQTFGCLDNISCFKYENHMQKIKKKLHKSRMPLQELCNRISEEFTLPLQSREIEEYPSIVYRKNDISSIRFQNFTLATNDIDNCALLADNSMVLILDILKDNGILCVRAKRFLNPTSFFNIPCPSEKFGIYLISNSTNSEIIQVPLTQIKTKCVKIKLLQDVDSYVTIPLISQNN